MGTGGAARAHVWGARRARHARLLGAPRARTPHALAQGAPRREIRAWRTRRGRGTGGRRARARLGRRARALLGLHPRDCLPVGGANVPPSPESVSRVRDA